MHDSEEIVQAYVKEYISLDDGLQTLLDVISINSFICHRDSVFVATHLCLHENYSQ